MDLEGRKSNVYFDKTGRQILEGDLLQIFHFRTKSKVHYMYHVAAIEDTKDFPVMGGRAYFNEKPHYRFYVMCNNEQRVYHEAKIISELDYQTKRLKIKVLNEKSL